MFSGFFIQALSGRCEGLYAGLAIFIIPILFSKKTGLCKGYSLQGAEEEAFRIHLFVIKKDSL